MLNHIKHASGRDIFQQFLVHVSKRGLSFTHIHQGYFTGIGAIIWLAPVSVKYPLIDMCE